MLKQKLGDRFSNIFNRDKKDKEKQEEGRKDQQVYFNQSYFECKLVYNPHRLSLIKVIANIMVGPDAGTPMMVSCKWLIKKNGQYSEIQGVTSSCYQPCIEDVGCSVLVQITPLIEGKIYSGATIAKQTGPLQLGSTLETRFTETKNKLYYQKQQIEFSTKIQAVFGKQTDYSNLEYPQDGRLLIRKHEDANFEIEVITQEFKTYFWITKQFPTVEFIRKSYNSVVVSFSQYQSMRLAFKQGTDRQILGLLLRTLTANSTLDWKSKENTQNENNDIDNQKNDSKYSNSIEAQQNIELEQDVQQAMKTSLLKSEKKLDNFSEFNIAKIQEKDLQNLQVSAQKMQNSPQKQQHNEQHTVQQLMITPTKSDQNSLIQLASISPSVNSVQLELKIGDLNIELNKLRKEYKQLMKNYNIEKQNKCKLEHQVKKSNDRVVQFQKVQKQRDDALLSNEKLKEDNRFLKNQVALLNKNFKKKEQDILNIVAEKQALQLKIKKQELSNSETNKADTDYLKNESENWRKLNNQLTEQNQQLKAQIQKLENNLKKANKKLESLSLEKMISSQQYPKSEPTIPIGPSLADLAIKDKTISNLETKITNLQMLLKHRSGEKGNEALALHKIINSMTEDITQKEEQLEHAKKLNKQLVQKIQHLTKALSDK